MRHSCISEEVSGPSPICKLPINWLQGDMGPWKVDCKVVLVNSLKISEVFLDLNY